MLRLSTFHLTVFSIGLCLSAHAAEQEKTPTGYVRASALVDATIRDASGDEHAKIVDVLLSPTHDQARFALVRCQDHDDVDFLVPVETLTFGVDESGDVVLGVQRASLIAMKSIARDGGEATEKSDACRVRDLLGKPVTDTAGDALGTVEDFLISRTTGAIPLAILATGGVLGLGETSHVVPPTALRSTTTEEGERRLSLATTKDLLANAPKCDGKSCPDPSDTALLARLDELFTPATTTRDATIVHASTIVGTAVRLKSLGGDLGKVEDVTFDPVDGRLAFVVLELDELPGVDDCTVAVPWQAVSYDAEAEQLTLDVDAKRLAATECRVNEGAQDLQDESIRDRVTRWFGFEPTPVTAVGDPQTVCANELLERDVRDTTGNEVGEIEDVAVEPRSGQLRYVAVLLDRGNDKLVALKWNELAIPKEKSEVTLLVAPPQLRSDRGLRPNGRNGERRDG